jgi:hypothetical protein
MHGTLVVSAMPMALIGRLIALVRVVYCDIMSTDHFAVRQSRVGPLWLSIEALLEPFLIKKPYQHSYHFISPHEAGSTFTPEGFEITERPNGRGTA